MTSTTPLRQRQVPRNDKKHAPGAKRVSGPDPGATGPRFNWIVSIPHPAWAAPLFLTAPPAISIPDLISHTPRPRALTSPKGGAVTAPSAFPPYFQASLHSESTLL